MRWSGLPPTDDVRARFSLNLRERRSLLGISQEELAFRAGLNRTLISLLEKGKRIGRIDTVIRLAGAAESTPNELAAGILWTPPEEAIAEQGGFLVLDDPDLAAEVAALRGEDR